MSLILSLSLSWLINQDKPSQAKFKHFGFPTSLSSNIILGLSLARAELNFLTFINKPILNMYYSTKLSSFITLRCVTMWIYLPSC